MSEKKDYLKELLEPLPSGRRLFEKDIIDEKLENRDAKRVESIDLQGSDLFKECSEILASHQKDAALCKQELLDRFMRSIKAVYLESNRSDLESIIEHRLNDAVQKDQAKYDMPLSKEYNDNFKKKKREEILKQVLAEDVHPDKEFDRSQEHKKELESLESKHSEPLKALIDNAVDKLLDGDNSLNQKKERSWFNFPGKICDSLTKIFRDAALLMGAEPNAKELFEKAAKYSQQAKDNIEKTKNISKELALLKIEAPVDVVKVEAIGGSKKADIIKAYSQAKQPKKKDNPKIGGEIEMVDLSLSRSTRGR